MSERSVLGEWVETVRRELGITAEVDQTLVLDLAREVAHGVARPAAPVTAYLMGLAVAEGADPKQTAALLTSLAQSSQSST